MSLKDNICIFVKLHCRPHISEKLKAFKKLKEQGFPREKIYETIATDDFFNISKNWSDKKILSLSFLQLI